MKYFFSKIDQLRWFYGLLSTTKGLWWCSPPQSEGYEVFLQKPSLFLKKCVEKSEVFDIIKSEVFECVGSEVF